MVKHQKAKEFIGKDCKDLSALIELARLPEDKFDKIIMVIQNNYCLHNNAKNESLDKTVNDSSKKFSHEWIVNYAISHNHQIEFSFGEANEERLSWHSHEMICKKDSIMSWFNQAVEKFDRTQQKNVCTSSSLTDTKLIKMLKEVGEHPTFQLPFAIAALTNLDNANNRVHFYDQAGVTYYQQAGKLTSVAGIYSNGATAIATKNREDKQIKSTFIHEVEHQIINLIFDNDSNPYKKEDAEKAINFEIIRPIQAANATLPCLKNISAGVL